MDKFYELCIVYLIRVRVPLKYTAICYFYLGMLTKNKFVMIIINYNVYDLLICGSIQRSYYYIEFALVRY